jgi:hypothetical protein
VRGMEIGWTSEHSGGQDPTARLIPYLAKPRGRGSNPVFRFNQARSEQVRGRKQTEVFPTHLSYVEVSVVAMNH